MTQTHTPLPWEFRQGTGDDYEVFPTRGGPPEHGSWAEVAVCPDQYDEEDEARANATFIVTACNSYYDNQATIASQAAEIATLRNKVEARRLTDQQLRDEINAVDAVINAGFEEGGGSPGEWWYERSDELEHERKRRELEAQLSAHNARAALEPRS